MKSVLLHIYDDTALETRLQAALSLSRAFGSHITCLQALPFDDYLRNDPLVLAILPEAFSRRMAERRNALAARIGQRLSDEGARWDWTDVNSTMSKALISASVLSDIVIISQAERALMKDEPRPLAASVAIGGRAPVLVTPQHSNGLNLKAPAVIAWNGTPEAAAALRAALPILRLASKVYLLEVDGRSSPYPREIAVRYLSAHGVGAEILQRTAGGTSVSEVIRAGAVELCAGTLVMGAYGHSRLRESVLGGVTRDLLGDSPVPLLLGH